jgi:hypothetical protein
MFVEYESMNFIKIKFEDFENHRCFMDSFSTNLFDQLYGLMFVKDSDTITITITIMLRRTKIKDFQKISYFVDLFVKTWPIGTDSC